MEIISKTIFIESGTKISFIRVKPGNLYLTIRDILSGLANLSWLAKVAPESIRQSFRLNAEKTVKLLERKLNDLTDESSIKETAGEYIVSVLAKNAVIDEMKHIDIPLTELLGRKSLGNPGFDFYTEEGNPNFIIFCGESKYENNKNAYSSSLSQIVRFINEEKHISDLMLIEKFTTDNGKENLVNGLFGITSAFSSKSSMDDHEILDNIRKNTCYKTLIEISNSIILIGVDVS
jgi:hypothetical protein